MASPRLDLEGLYRAHAVDVARWAGRLGGPAFDVEDAVHEVFLVVRSELDTFRGDAKITTWLYRITLNVVRYQRRKRRILCWLGLPIETTQETSQPQPDAILERKEDLRALYSVLDTLPEKYRTVLILHEIEELSGQEIAELTGVTASTVWVRLHRARKLFVRSFERAEARGGSR